MKGTYEFQLLHISGSMISKPTDFEIYFMRIHGNSY